jgi:hypothetical protein
MIRPATQAKKSLLIGAEGSDKACEKLDEGLDST